MSDDFDALDDSACWARLRTAQVGRIARVQDGRPAIRPVNFVVDRGTLLVRTAGRSWIAGASGEAVVFEADGTLVGDEGATVVWSVLVEGRARLLTATSELLDTIGHGPSPWHSAPKPVFLRIEPVTMTGRRFGMADPSTWRTALSDVPRTASE